VQWELVRSMRGFESARITRPGYAIEYDFFDPRDLRASLETKFVEGLFFAGQINGTTGYEEAAAQGLLAGLNAGRTVQGLDSWSPRRDEAYLGVLVDDLITRGTAEPYRMFTSRAEYRLLLREDNADLRLTETGRGLGLVDDARWSAFEAKREAIVREQQRLRDTWVRPGQVDAQRVQAAIGDPLRKEARALELIARPQASYASVTGLPGVGTGVSDLAVCEQVEIQAKYAGYIDRQCEEIQRARNNEALRLPRDLDFGLVKGLSSEVREKLGRHRPETIGQAGRIPGVTPAAVSLLLIHMKKKSA
jgi:tRNA uridine 5-carboxymethylaminomethyl modification enzyme